MTEFPEEVQENVGADPGGPDAEDLTRLADSILRGRWEAQQAFMRSATYFGTTELHQGGRVLVPTQSQRLRGARNIVLSPMESRHEQALRSLLTQVAMLTARLEVLEGALGVEGTRAPAEPESDQKPAEGCADFVPREAGSDGVGANDGESRAAAMGPVESQS